MTAPDIAGLCKKLRAALKGVTPGPWDDTRGRSGLRIIEGDSGCPVASYVSEKDAAFIALSREAAPVLLDTLERQAAEIERLRDKVEGLESDLRCAVQVAYNRGATEWARLNYPDMIEWLESCAEARAALTGEDAPGSSTNQNTEPGLAFSAPVELSGNPGEPKPLMTAQELADHAADAFDDALPDDALPHEVGRAWKAVGERLAAILTERAEK